MGFGSHLSINTNVWCLFMLLLAFIKVSLLYILKTLESAVIPVARLPRWDSAAQELRHHPAVRTNTKVKQWCHALWNLHFWKRELLTREVHRFLVYLRWLYEDYIFVCFATPVPSVSFSPKEFVRKRPTNPGKDSSKRLSLLSPAGELWFAAAPWVSDDILAVPS